MALNPPCAIFGSGLNDPLRNMTPSVFLNNSQLCQDACAESLYCTQFTYYTNTQGCWLQGNISGYLILSPYAIRGPVQCPKIAPPILPIIVGNTTIVGNTPIAGNKEFIASDTQTSSEAPVGGGFPWWIVLVVLLALILCVGLAWWFMGGSSEKKTKKKKKTIEVKGAATDEEAPLVTSRQAAPEAAAAFRQVAAPVQMMSGASVASPVAYQQVAAPMSYSVAAPGSYSSAVAPPQYSSQVMMPVAQPYQVAAPMSYSVAAPQYVRAPQYVTTSTAQQYQGSSLAAQPADLFTQLDADGDGFLSREELAAGMASLQR